MNKLSIGRRLFASGRRLFSSNAPSTETLKLNFCTPHGIIYSGKSVEQLVLPGDDGEYGITVGHSSIISQLQPGVVSIVHTSGETEKFFVPGGFALTHADSVTDISVPEAFSLADFDEAAVKAGYAEAMKLSADGQEDSVKAKAMIEVSVYSNLARELGISI